MATPEELLRRAGWVRLADEDRAAQLRIFRGQDVPSFGDVATESGLGPDTKLQDWIALVVSMRLQPQASGVVRSWLDDGAPTRAAGILLRPGGDDATRYATCYSLLGDTRTCVASRQ
jgi:hypothetical protein